MLSQLANINCIIAHHLTDGVFKKTQDKTSIAMSCVATRPKAVFTNPKFALLGYLLHWQ